MPYKVFLDYFKAIEVLNARESLDEIRNTSFSNMKKESQEKIRKDLMRKAKNIRADSGIELAPERAAEIMARRMLEVKSRGR